MEKAHGFVFRYFKGMLVLLLPFGGAALKALSQYIRGPVRSVAYAAGGAAQHAAKGAGAPAYAPKQVAPAVGFGLDKAAFKAVAAYIAVKGKLEPRLGGVILIVSGI